MSDLGNQRDLFKDGFEDEIQRITAAKKPRKGMRFEHYFTNPSVHPYDEIEWDYRKSAITNDAGQVIFEEDNIEVPAFWSSLATNVVTSKYFSRWENKTENSVKQLINRVVRTISNWGMEDGYFSSQEDAKAFEWDLTHILVHQKASFNSPVWFNLGLIEHPQVSACFINSVEDSMDSILELAKTEGLLFKFGSGTGTNLSTLRSSKEKLSTGGSPSGPVSFMKGYDAFAGVIKSGGRTRRAAKMVILNVDHPDVMEFIDCKVKEERKAHVLIDAGYSGAVDGEAYQSVYFQNSNNSVRVSDHFMHAVENDKKFYTKAVVDKEPIEEHKAKDILRRMANAAWECGDPGIQYDDTINRWHTCPNSGRINASNPCSEYMFLDDTACNLSSINLMPFMTENGFDVESFRKAVRIMITAQEILVDRASYPRKQIAVNSHLYRTLGLGYSNLGAVLMSLGLPYDSPEGRGFASVVTSIMTGEGYRTSAEIAAYMDPFEEYKINQEAFLNVMNMHAAATDKIEAKYLPNNLLEKAKQVWKEAIHMGELYGYRNAQTTVLAPTGTISFMMDCDTTGIEPDIALVKYKNFVGGGRAKIVNQTVPIALKWLGYSEKEIQSIVAYIDEHDTLEGAPELQEKHLPVFDCAFKPRNGVRYISYMGHVRMMAAVQPFISGAISKTVNLPTDATVEDIEKIYLDGWKLGLKAIAIYRDGCKRTQPLSLGESDKPKSESKTKVIRRRLPDERQSITHKFSIAGHEGYLTVGMYEDNTPGEIFITMAKEGSVVSGLMSTVATLISIALQYGVPLEVLVRKFSHLRFEPAGITSNPAIPIAKSIIDYIFRWLQLKFGNKADLMEHDENSSSNVQSFKVDDKPNVKFDLKSSEDSTFQNQADAPPCPDCGMIMVRNGACYKCINCGSVHGCS
jgi:ribonucleoside-diphosphate reductase alpha chain